MADMLGAYHGILILSSSYTVVADACAKVKKSGFSMEHTSLQSFTSWLSVLYKYAVKAQIPNPRQNW